MNKFRIMVKTMFLALVFAVSAFAQDKDTAYVPFIINVDAVATARLDGVNKFEETVRAGYTDTLLIIAEGGGTPLARQGKTPNPVTMYSSRGRISLELSRELYRSADIALYSLNGKQVLRGSGEHPNLAMGVYLLSVKGVNGSAFTARFAHSGGGLGIDVGFANGNSGSLFEKPILGNWTITVSAEGYLDTSYAFFPETGRGNTPVQVITLRSSSSSETSSSSSLVQGPISCPISSVSDGSVTCGGQTYRTVNIGDQVWFAENLNYNSGTGNSSCYDGLASNCTTYGRLYDWSTALTVCPSGWHLPSQAEWQTLLSAIGGAGGYGGRMLKATSGWNNGGNGDDNFGFSALPGGYFDSAFRNVGNTGTWWTATELGNNAIYRYILYSNNDLYNLSLDKSSLFSVRCVQSSSSSEIIQSSSSVEVIEPSCSGNDNTSTHYCSEGIMKKYVFLTDNRDEQNYKAVVIGTQTWMAENLNFNATNSKCFDDNTGGDSRDNCVKYGRLYKRSTAMNGETISTSVPNGVRGVCPAGWHLPSELEWEVMIAHTGGNSEGRKLKATSGWYNDDNGVSGNGTDDYGFSALPGGRYIDGAFYDAGDRSYWWSARNDVAYYWSMSRRSPEGISWGIMGISDNELFSVRCVQDAAYEDLCTDFVEGTKRLHYEKEKEQFCDERDGKRYVYVTIGDQTWMAENLNYAASSSKCYGKNGQVHDGSYYYENGGVYDIGDYITISSAEVQANCAEYGRLYNWTTAMNGAASSTSAPSGVRGVCPAGWHLPSRAELEVMMAHIGGDYTGGKKLKTTSDWNWDYLNNVSGNGTDDYGFSALPSGSGTSGGSYSRAGYMGYWWASDYIWSIIHISESFGGSFGSDVNNINLFSVRCLQD